MELPIKFFFVVELVNCLKTFFHGINKINDVYVQTK